MISLTFGYITTPLLDTLQFCVVYDAFDTNFIGDHNPSYFKDKINMNLIYNYLFDM